MASHDTEPPRESGAHARQEQPTATLDDEGILKTIMKHPVVLLCCVYANLGTLMYGFDNITLSLCLSMQPFLEQFGTLENGSYIIPAYWQSLWNALPQLTTGLGAWASGPIADRFGRRLSFFIAGVISVIGVAVVYTASHNGTFLAGKMVNAIGLGMAVATGQTYISEITPLRLRGIALSAFAFSMNLGFLIAASISFKRVTIPDSSAYKVVFAAQWACPAVLVLVSYLIPESPYHLVRKKKTEAAVKALKSLYRTSTPVQPILRVINDTIQHEEYIGESSFRECFRGINWRRTRIVLYANGLSQMIGATFISNAPYFMITAGMSSTKTAMMVELGIGLAIISSSFTFWALSYVGRRALVLSGTIFAGLLFFIMGVASSVSRGSSSSLWCVGITLQLVWLTIGPAIGPVMSVAAEVSSVRLRAKTLAIGFLFNYIYSTIWNVVVPYMYNPDEGNLGGLMGWIFLATSIIAGLVLWFELPETKGLTFAEIDEKFEMRVAARHFNTWRDTSVPVKSMELGQVEQLEEVAT